ncbi:DUF397 domain-containing protein [Streptomyces sp. NRRL S-646]|uniref:DUF397 domain-containing protein n=1 Tax=Streptomyces sp. NRRL S-646 TaxID=1463917 RepID=UPI00099CB70F|nr:DUF397 domain-containing protein [Streptomyces sp. NRRL S-646]
MARRSTGQCASWSCRPRVRCTRGSGCSGRPRTDDFGEDRRPAGYFVVARNIPGTVAVRDSKDADGPILQVTPGVWTAFPRLTDRLPT